MCSSVGKLEAQFTTAQIPMINDSTTDFCTRAKTKYNAHVYTQCCLELNLMSNTNDVVLNKDLTSH